MHEDIDAVLSAHLHIVELLPLHAIDIEIEFGSALPFDTDAGDVEHLLVAVIHKKLRRGSSLLGENGVERKGIDRKFQHVAARSGEAVFDTRRNERQH